MYIIITIPPPIASAPPFAGGGLFMFVLRGAPQQKEVAQHYNPPVAIASLDDSPLWSHAVDPHMGAFFNLCAAGV